LYIGVGAAKVVRRIEVLWPSGTKQELRDVPVNQVLVIKEP
jgi:ASPIC and UnbV